MITMEQWRNELYHSGVIGMKWGVRRYQNLDGSLTPDGRERYSKGPSKEERKELKTLRRHLSAGAKNLKTKAKTYEYSDNAVTSAQKRLDKETNRFTLRRKKKQQRVNDLLTEMQSMQENRNNAADEFRRASRIYSQDAKRYKKLTASIIKKYGDTSIKAVETKTFNSGKKYVMELVKTGPTVANVPLIGDLYTRNYISKQMYRNRANEV